MVQGDEREMREATPAGTGDDTDSYDSEAESSWWFGPETAFGLVWRFIEPGESVIDIGAGTGLCSELFRKAGLGVTVMDLSKEMLEFCGRKGFESRVRHDLMQFPYPFADGCFDHAVSTGVFNFFRDLSPVFAEVARIIRPKGMFVFVTGDSAEDGGTEMTVPSEHSGTDRDTVIYMHSPNKITGWLEDSGLMPKRQLAFSVYMDPERKRRFPARAYLAGKGIADGR